jgi:hypothetical protein
MPRSRSRSPRNGELINSDFYSFFILFNLDRYGGNRYRGAAGGGPPNAVNSRRRNSRSRSPRDRDARMNDRRDRHQQRSERPTKRYSKSRSPSPKAFGNKIVDKRNEPAQRIFDRKKIYFFYLFIFLFSLQFILASELQGKTEDEIEMLKTMGFATFDSTKVNNRFCFNTIFFNSYL